jgi:predicted Mrr-cat superfamily restriction endonuclease
MSAKAYVLRIAPGRNDKVPEALRENEIIIGWSKARGLLDPALDWDQFREIVRATYYIDRPNLRRAGAAAGHLWRFIREMDVADRVVVPYGRDFYVAEVIGPARYCESKVEEDTAHRRKVTWLNDKRPIPRILAQSALVSRMKTYGTCADATDLYGQINDCLEAVESGKAPTFESDLQARLVRETLDELRSGRMDSYGFERLVQTVMTGLGASETLIVPRSQDKGADIYAVFHVAKTFRQVVAIQAKHWQPRPPVPSDVVEQLVRGIEEGTERATLGMVITTGEIGEDAYRAAEAYAEKGGIPIELIDGEQLARLIVEHGIRRA